VRRRHQMHVVRHQAVRMHVQAVARGLLSQSQQVELIIVGDEEDILTVIAALGDVVRGVGDNGSCESGHVAMIPRLPLMSTENLVTVPLNTVADLRRSPERRRSAEGAEHEIDIVNQEARAEEKILGDNAP